MADRIDLREISSCSCLHVRRAARRLTRLYDRALAPAGLTVNQFGLLANLHGAGSKGLAMGALAERLTMDPTTLNRDLKPLRAEGLVRDAADPGDRRVRLIQITPKGSGRLVNSLPHWRAAQARTEELLGREPVRELTALLDLATRKLAD